MELKIHIYYRNRKTGNFHTFHEQVTEEDIESLAKQKTESKPMWMDENWEYDSTSVGEIKL